MGTGSPKAAGQAVGVTVAILDLLAILRMIQSCATVHAVAGLARVDYKTYKDSAVLNACYNVMLWKDPPGFSEVHLPTRKELHDTTSRYAFMYMEKYLDTVFKQGQDEGQKYLETLQARKEQDAVYIQKMFEEVSKLNTMVAAELQTAKNNAVKVRVCAQVGVTVIGGIAGIGFVAKAAGATTGFAGACLKVLTASTGTLTVGGASVTGYGAAGAGAFSFGAVGFLHSVGYSMIKTWEDTKTAKIVAFSTEGAKYVANEGGGGKALAGYQAAAGRSVGDAVAKVEDEAAKKLAKLAAEAQEAHKSIKVAEELIAAAEAKIVKFSESLTARYLKLNNGKGFRKKTADQIIAASEKKAATHAGQVQAAKQEVELQRQALERAAKREAALKAEQELVQMEANAAKASMAKQGTVALSQGGRILLKAAYGFPVVFAALDLREQIGDAAADLAL
jgi:hypothetical protein